MKTLTLLLICSFCCLIQLSAQKTHDIIYRTNGDSVICKITKADSTDIYFEMMYNNKKTKSFIGRKEVADYKTNVVIPKNTLSNNSKFCLSFDPVGFITMGPMVTGEILIQKENKSSGAGIYAGLRITNLGLATRILLDAKDMKTSFTIPFGIRFYPKTRSKADGFFIGPHIEYGKSFFNSGSKNNVRAFGGQLGYKWVFDSFFTLELNYGIGIIQLKWEESSKTITNYYPGGSSTTTYYTDETDWETLAFVPYMISLKLGKTF